MLIPEVRVVIYTERNQRKHSTKINDPTSRYLSWLMKWIVELNFI